MFAFALLDRQRRELVLARDPFGIKPLFWASGSGLFAIASEIGPLLEVPGVRREIDQARACLFLSAGQTDESERTMFAGVRSLPAGSFARVALDAPSVRPISYWAPTVAPYERAPGFAARELRETFLESVELHLRSDVPTGIALSGGIDSSAILACARHVGGPKLDLRTFSFTATGSEVDETPYIELAARAAGAQSHMVRIEPDEIVNDIDRLVAVQGEPFGSLSMYAQHRVMGLARQHGIKVILDGQGADELFAGYRPYLARRLTELLASFRVTEAIRFMRAMVSLPGASPVLIAQALEPAVSPRLRGLLRRIIGRPVAAAVDRCALVRRPHGADHRAKPRRQQTVLSRCAGAGPDRDRAAGAAALRRSQLDGVFDRVARAVSHAGARRSCLLAAGGPTRRRPRQLQGGAADGHARHRSGRNS